MEVRIIITGVFLAIGCFLVVVASIGVVRFPDLYSRMHPAGKADTLGQMMILVGLMIYEGFTLTSVKLLFIIVFIFIANPTATHAIANAAYTAGIKPWEKGDKRQ